MLKLQCSTLISLQSFHHGLIWPQVDPTLTKTWLTASLIKWLIATDVNTEYMCSFLVKVARCLVKALPRKVTKLLNVAWSLNFDIFIFFLNLWLLLNDHEMITSYNKLTNLPCYIFTMHLLSNMNPDHIKAAFTTSFTTRYQLSNSFDKFTITTR